MYLFVHDRYRNKATPRIGTARDQTANESASGIPCSTTRFSTVGQVVAAMACSSDKGYEHLGPTGTDVV